MGMEGGRSERVEREWWGFCMDRWIDGWEDSWHCGWRWVGAYECVLAVMEIEFLSERVWVLAGY